MCLVVVSRLIEVTRPLTKQLQSPSIYVTSCVEQVKLLFSMLLRIRAEIDELHQKWFIEATELGMIVGTTPPEPRTVERQTYCANTPSGCPEEYYRRVLSLPF